jgi:hypothetical protein
VQAYRPGIRIVFDLEGELAEDEQPDSAFPDPVGAVSCPRWCKRPAAAAEKRLRNPVFSAAALGAC